MEKVIALIQGFSVLGMLVSAYIHFRFFGLLAEMIKAKCLRMYLENDIYAGGSANGLNYGSIKSQKFLFERRYKRVGSPEVIVLGDRAYYSAICMMGFLLLLVATVIVA